MIVPAGPRPRRVADRDAAHRSSERRGDAAVARRPARGRAGAGPTTARRCRERRRARRRHGGGARWPVRCCWSASATRRVLATKSSPTDPVSEADLSRRARDPRAAARGAAPTTRSSVRRATTSPARAGAGGSSTRSTGRRTTSTASRSGRSASPASGEAGVVFDPVRDELFAAGPDGATLNGDAAARQRAATTCRARSSSTGFAYDAQRRAAQATVVARVLPRVRDIRRGGSAALDLAWLAAGRADAYYERGIQLWDTAAGALLCARAGLEVHAARSGRRRAGRHPRRAGRDRRRAAGARQPALR